MLYGSYHDNIFLVFCEDIENIIMDDSYESGMFIVYYRRNTINKLA
jgi:hypothetical protein